MNDGLTAFWLQPDWSGGDSLRDGAEPFWLLPMLIRPDEVRYTHTPRDSRVTFVGCSFENIDRQGLTVYYD